MGESFLGPSFYGAAPKMSYRFPQIPIEPLAPQSLLAQDFGLAVVLGNAFHDSIATGLVQQQVEFRSQQVAVTRLHVHTPRIYNILS
jgi:hypothetical protein